MTEKHYRIADAHTHIYPMKIAAKASVAIGDFYDISMNTVGSAEHLLEKGAQIGTGKYLICSVATTPAQVEHINDFIAAECAEHSRFMGVATLHPGMDGESAIEREIVRARQLGLRGIKLHPDFQKFNIDAPEAMPIYRLAAKWDMPVLFHTGDDRYDYSAPERLRAVVDAVPGFRVVAAHFGGYRRWEDAARCLADTNVMFDTSSSLPFIGADMAAQLISLYGASRLMFGTDFPMWDAKEEFERFMAIPIAEQERRDILCGNFERFYNVKVAE